MDEITAFVKTRQPVNFAVAGINVLVFLVLSMMGNPESSGFMLNHGAMFTPYVVERGEYYRLFTCMFLHFGMEHLIFNMLLLIYLGDLLEKRVGKLRYLIIYLGGGILGNLLSFAMDLAIGQPAISAGASGAIFAVTGAMLYLVLRSRGRMKELSGRSLILMICLNVLNGFTSSGIDNAAHIGGLIGGFVLAWILGSRKACNQND